MFKGSHESFVDGRDAVDCRNHPKNTLKIRLLSLNKMIILSMFSLLVIVIISLSQLHSHNRSAHLRSLVLS